MSFTAESDPFQFIHPVIWWIFIGTYYVSGTVLGAGDTVLDKTNRIPYVLKGQGAE